MKRLYVLLLIAVVAWVYALKRPLAVVDEESGTRVSASQPQSRSGGSHRSPRRMNPDDRRWMESRGMEESRSWDGESAPSVIVTVEDSPYDDSAEPDEDSDYEEEVEEEEDEDEEDEDGNAGADRVVIYTATWCPHCRAAIQYLQRARVPFVTRDIDRQPGAKDDLIDLTGSASIPVAIIRGEVVRGFSPEAYQQALGID